MGTTNELPQPKLATSASQAAPAAATEDLSDAIERVVEKQRGEQVRSVRVYGDRYRCNWWVQEKLAGPEYLNAGRIVRSKFYRATRVDNELLLEDLSIARATKA